MNYPDKTLKQILTDAADLGEKHGVAKGVFLSHDGSMCINGLLAVAITGEPLKQVGWYTYAGNHEVFDVISSLNSPSPYREAKVLIESAAPEIGDFDGLASWNNGVAKPGEVVSVLRKAAALVSEEADAV